MGSIIIKRQVARLSSTETAIKSRILKCDLFCILQAHISVKDEVQKAERSVVSIHDQAAVQVGVFPVGSSFKGQCAGQG